jgi:hypothetical protein
MDQALAGECGVMSGSGSRLCPASGRATGSAFSCNCQLQSVDWTVCRSTSARDEPNHHVWIRGNSKMFLITAQQSREDVKEIGEALSLSPKTIETINNYPLPELMDPRERFSAFTYVANDRLRRLVGTVKNVASRELLFAASSDNETFDQRKAALSQYRDIVTGIIEESGAIACAKEESATEPIL